MKKILLLIVTILLIPKVAFALPAASITTSADSIEKGSPVIVTVTITDTAAWNIKIVGNGAASCFQKQVDVTSDARNITKEFSLTCTSTTEGTIDISLTGDITSEMGETKDISLSKQVTVNRPKSSINTLNTIKVNNTTVPNFSSSITTYNLKDTTDSKITISAEATDTNATVNGTGEKTLKDGDNTFTIEVVAENGSTNTYTLKIKKVEPKSNDVYLNSLTVNHGELEFDKDKTEYLVIVDHHINEIKIGASSDDLKATVSGTGTMPLQDYVNVFNVEVKNENNVTKTYTIKVARKDENGDYGIIDSEDDKKEEKEKDDKKSNIDKSTIIVIIEIIAIVIVVLSIIYLLVKKQKPVAKEKTTKKKE